MEPRDDDLVVRGKADLLPTEGLAVSGKTGAGLDQLVGEITRILESRAAGGGVMTRERHRIAMKTALQAMESARNEVLLGSDRARWQRKSCGLLFARLSP